MSKSKHTEAQIVAIDGTVLQLLDVSEIKRSLEVAKTARDYRPRCNQLFDAFITEHGRAQTCVRRQAYAMAGGDFNGDGRLDLAVTNGGVCIFPGNGDGTFGQPVLYTATAGAIGLAAGDFNGDGILDLAVGSGGVVSILLGNGAGGFQAIASYYAHGSAESPMAIGDFNGDGFLDLAVAGRTIQMLLGRGDGTFVVGPEYAPPAAPAWAVAGDFFGTGRLDLAVSTFADAINLLKNTTP